MESPGPDEETFFALSETLRMTKPTVGRPVDPSFDFNDTELDADISSMDLIKTVPATLLDLPQNVKIHILEDIGLVRSCLIDITNEGSRAKQATCNTCDVRDTVQTQGSWITKANRPCDHPRLPTQVLMASREFREDLGALFFAHNRFSVVLSNKADWQNFFEAVDWAAEDIRYLHVELRTWNDRVIKPGGQRILLNLWARFCKYLGEHMVNLRYFSLKCRVRDSEVALKIMSEMGSFPVLLQCAIHFSQAVEYSVRPLTKEIALKLIGNLGAKPAFPYSSLPKEVQLMILELLLANQVEPFMLSMGRKPGDVMLIDRKTRRMGAFNRYRNHHPLTCCGTCSPLQALCFCFARQTAYSTTCSCVSSPVQYFLVSRAFYEDARRIFFSKNRFIFREEDPDAMMRFMAGIPTATFMMIRDLVLQFPPLWTYPFRHARTFNDHFIMGHWSVWRRFIRDHFDVSRLSIMIVDLCVQDSWPRHPLIRVEYLRRIIKGFQDLRGLREFRVYLMRDRIFEVQAEQLIMGRAIERTPEENEFPYASHELSFWVRHQ